MSLAEQDEGLLDLDDLQVSLALESAGNVDEGAHFTLTPMPGNATSVSALSDVTLAYRMDVAGTVTFVASGPVPAPAGCNEADLAEPFDALDFSDVVAFLTAFGSMDPAADLAPPTGVFDFSDVVAFLGAFGAGCP